MQLLSKTATELEWFDVPACSIMQPLALKETEVTATLMNFIILCFGLLKVIIVRTYAL